MERIVRLWAPIYHRGKLTNYDVSDDGKVRNRNSRIILHQREMRRLNRDGSYGKPYYKVTLWIDNKTVSKVVHRLVAEAFIPNPENKPVPNHIDGNTLNNDVRNLEWATHSENTQHAYDTGLIKKRHILIKYTKDAIHNVCELLETSDLRTGEISKLTGVGYDTIYGILIGKFHTPISSKYDFSRRRKKLKCWPIESNHDK